MAVAFSTLDAEGAQNELTQSVSIACRRSAMRISVGVTIGSLSFCPHPTTINLGSKAVRSVANKGE
jgi:hypothetical protein